MNPFRSSLFYRFPDCLALLTHLTLFQNDLLSSVPIRLWILDSHSDQSPCPDSSLNIRCTSAAIFFWYLVVAVFPFSSID